MNHETPAGRRDRHQTAVQSRIFLAIGVAVAVMAAIYLRLSYEEAGTVMLALASALSFVCGGYLWWQTRRRGDPAGAGAELYLPHASIWPFWLGVAAFLLANGLVLGLWFLVPGAVLLVAGMVGFIRQSRSRSHGAAGGGSDRR